MYSYDNILITKAEKNMERLVTKLTRRKNKFADDIYNIQNNVFDTIVRIQKEIEYIEKANKRLLRKCAVRKILLKTNSIALEKSGQYMEYLDDIRKMLSRIQKNSANELIGHIDDYQQKNEEAINVLFEIN